MFHDVMIKLYITINALLMFHDVMIKVVYYPKCVAYVPSPFPSIVTLRLFGFDYRLFPSLRSDAPQRLT